VPPVVEPVVPAPAVYASEPTLHAGLEGPMLYHATARDCAINIALTSADNVCHSAGAAAGLKARAVGVIVARAILGRHTHRVTVTACRVKGPALCDGAHGPVATDCEGGLVLHPVVGGRVEGEKWQKREKNKTPVNFHVPPKSWSQGACPGVRREIRWKGTSAREPVKDQGVEQRNSRDSHM